ncbi:MAG TPA: MBG domain-containing protein [Thermodesulfovibrionales bacterium]|jgi:2',3'-cyclic-nucleotide 2'-phosphodiesterase (5'-nucleotidase family)|nr:MBG domain-containing protein [Thermodesulfovibrionales bacterium]
MNFCKRLPAIKHKNLFIAFIIVAFGLTAGTATEANVTIFHVNDTHARLTPHKMIVPAHGTSDSQFEDVGGAAYLAGKMLQLTAANPEALVIDAGDISEGNPIGDFGGSTSPLTIGNYTIGGCAPLLPGTISSNCGMTQFYQLLSKKLLAQRGRGMDAVVVGNHDVRDASYIANLDNLKASGAPVLSVNVRDISNHMPHFAPYTVVTINGKKIGILGYTTSAAEVGASLSNTLEVVPCDWNTAGSPNPPSGTGCHIADYVNDLRNQGCDVVVFAPHIGHSALVDPAAPILVDTVTPRLPEVVVTGHWHTWAESAAWQPYMLNYKTIFTEAGSFMKYIGEIDITDTGAFVSATNHVLRNTDITPDSDVQAFIDNLIAQYDEVHPGHPIDEVVGYTASDLLLDNKMKWWSLEEYPWSGNNTAGQWICDAMQWKAAQLFGQCDLAFETGGGVRADIPAGPVTYLQIYETFPWSDDVFYRVNMTGQEIINFVKENNMDAGFSSGLDVTAFDGIPSSAKFNGQPIDVNHTYTVAINSYMYAHPPTGWTWSDTSPLTSTVLCRDGIVDYMRQFTAANPYRIGGPRYHLNTEFSGGYRAVVTMMNDNDTKPVYDDAFIRLLSATPETLARRGSKQVPTDMVNADGTINPANRLSENELYRSFLGFKTGALKPGDIIETWGKGSSYGGDPEFVDQEGIYGDGSEFKIVGHDESLGKPTFMTSISSFWNDNYKNHYVQFIAKKTGTNTVADQYGTTITIMDATAYTAKTLPGSVGDMLLISGIPTMESYGLRFRCDNVVVTTATFPPMTGPSSHMDPIPAGTVSSQATLSVTASVGAGLYNLTPVADSYVGSGRPTSNYGTSTTIYIQSSTTSTYGNERGWLRFDLTSIPAGASITGATLQLYNWGVAGAALPTEVRGGQSDTWIESGSGSITWNNQPAFGDVLDTQTLAAGTYNLWYNWNVTAFVQSKWTGNKLVSLVVKPVAEGSPDATAPSYKFDSKEYSSNKPNLQVATTASSATITQVQVFYRYSSDNATWGPWTSYVTIMGGPPYSTSFTFPQGYGYYEFYSRATDSNNNVEPAPAAAQAFTHYSATPAYYPIISLGSLYQKYDGSPKAVTVTTIPAGTSYGVTYNGSPTLPVNPGIYAVTATATQGGNTATTTGTLSIGPGAATISISNLNQTYDGTAKSVDVTTVPVGLAVAVTYNGSSTLPIGAGGYAVVANISDPNYIGAAATGTLTISKAAASVSLGTMNFTYDGSAKSVSVTTDPPGLNVTVTYNGSQTPPTGPGSYSVVATVNDPNYQGTAAGSMTISQAAPPSAVPALNGWGFMVAAVALGGYLAQRRRSRH